MITNSSLMTRRYNICFSLGKSGLCFPLFIFRVQSFVSFFSPFLLNEKTGKKVRDEDEAGDEQGKEEGKEGEETNGK